MLSDHTCIGSLSHIQRVRFPVICDIQHVTVRHLECRCLLLCHSGELLCDHILGNLFDCLSGKIDTVTPDMVTDFLLREFQHHLVGSPDTPVVHDSEILILGN